MESTAAISVALGHYYVSNKRGNRKKRIKDSYRKIWLSGTLFLIIWIMTYWPNETPQPYHLFMLLISNYEFWFSVGTFCLIMAIMELDIIQKILTWKPFLFYGDISFSFYLIHDVVQAAFSTWVFLIVWKIYHNKNLAILLAGIGYLVLATILGYIFHRWIDAPLQHFINAMYNKISIGKLSEERKINRK